MKKVLLLICFSLLIATTGYTQSRKDYDAAATRFQRYYGKNQPDSLYNFFSQRVKTNMTLANTKIMFADMNARQGKLKSIAYIKQDDRFTFYKLNFTKSTMALVIALNAENTLQSFRVAAYEGDDSKLK